MFKSDYVNQRGESKNRILAMITDKMHTAWNVYSEMCRGEKYARHVWVVSTTLPRSGKLFDVYKDIKKTSPVYLYCW